MPHSTADRSPRSLDWGLAFILLCAGLVGVAATIPLMLEWLPRLIGPEEEAKLRELPVPMPVVFLMGLVQNSVILCAAIVGGLALSKRVGFGAPELEAWRAGALRPGLARRLAGPLVLGLATGLVLIALDAFVLIPQTGAELAKGLAEVPMWKRLLGGVFYGGITEELLMRLFMVSLLVWLLGKVWSANGRPAAAAVGTAIVITTILFALGHLPVASRLTDLTPWLVIRVMVLNGVAGLVYGVLFVRRGLEAGMVAHAATHIPLQMLAGVSAAIAST